MGSWPAIPFLNLQPKHSAMKKNSLLFLFCLAFSALALAQQATLTPKVLASAGTTSTTSDVRLSFTVGETAISTLAAPGISFGQGFHNGAVLTVDTENPELADWGIRVFPNPVSQTLFVEFSDPEKRENLEASIWDTSGKLIRAAQHLSLDSNNAIEVDALPTGGYLLQFSGPNGKSLTVRFVKAN